MATSEFRSAVNQLASERGIPAEDVLKAIELAYVKAYTKEYGGEVEGAEYRCELDSDTGEARIFDSENKDVTPSGFGRKSAQIAGQAISQYVRESEKMIIQADFKDKIGIIITGTIFKIENGYITLDLGKTHGVMPYNEQIPGESYRIGQRIKVLVKDLRQTPRGMEVVVSRSAPEFVLRLFEAEVPEILNGTVEILGIAREAGSRTKMAVYSNDSNIDPVGSCVGQKGVRVQSIIQELNGEKLDIIPFATSVEKFIASALSPSRVAMVELDEEEKKAVVSVPEDQLSLAIGKEGQNVRLANKLTKWKIDIKGVKGVFDEVRKEVAEEKVAKKAVKGIWDEDIAKFKEEKEEEARQKEQTEKAKDVFGDSEEVDSTEETSDKN
jgi:N utilization substance protein A